MMMNSLTSNGIEKLVVQVQESSPLFQLLHHSEHTQTVTPEIVKAFEQLVKIVDVVRSPQGGWPVTKDPTPQNLTPYVIDETHDLLEAIRHRFISLFPDRLNIQHQAPTQGSLSHTPLHIAPQYASAQHISQHLALLDVIPYLLWSIARSSVQTMQLIGGLQADIFQPGQNWTSGTIRLLPILEITTPDLHWSIDLATLSPPTNILNTDSLIRWNDQSFAWHEALLQTVQAEITVSSLLSQMLLAPFRATVLVPGYSWQSGSLQLHLQLSFSSNATHKSSAIANPILPAIVKPAQTNDLEAKREDKDQTLELDDLFYGFATVDSDHSKTITSSESDLAVLTLDSLFTNLPDLKPEARERQPDSLNSSDLFSGWSAENLPETPDDYQTKPGLSLPSQELHPAPLKITKSANIDGFTQFNQSDTTVNAISAGNTNMQENLAEKNQAIDLIPTRVVTGELILASNLQVLHQWHINLKILTLPLFCQIQRYLQTPFTSENIAQISDQIDSLNSTYLLEESDRYGARLVEIACEILETQQTKLTGIDTQILPSSSTLENFVRQLSWQLIRYSYPLTRILGGVPARVLQPEWGWETGTLRLVPILCLQNSSLNLQLDLITETIAPLETLLVAPEILLHIDTLEWPNIQQPIEPFKSKVIHYIQQLFPEMLVLLEGITIEFRPFQQNWQAGTATLKFELEFH